MENLRCADSKRRVWLGCGWGVVHDEEDVVMPQGC